MAQDFQTSFIPTNKQGGAAPGSFIPGGSDSKKKDMLGVILFVITLIIFLATAIYAGYSVWFEKQLIDQIATLEDELLVIKQNIVDGDLASIERMNNRLIQSSGLLNRHVAPVLLFDMLEKETLPTMSFSKFDFETDGANVKITGNGQAANFESIVYQSDVFGKNKSLRDVLFTNLQRNQEGNVSFTFSAFVDQKSVLYLSRDFALIDGEREEVLEAQGEPTPGAPSDEASVSLLDGESTDREETPVSDEVTNNEV